MIENLYAAGGAAAGAAAPEGPSLIQAFFPLILIFVLFYFMFILPHKKEQKKQKEMLTALKTGDKVITSGGIVGIINKINEKDDILQLKVGENTLINVMRTYIARKIEKSA